MRLAIIGQIHTAKNLRKEKRISVKLQLSLASANPAIPRMFSKNFESIPSTEYQRTFKRIKFA